MVAYAATPDQICRVVQYLLSRLILRYTPRAME